MAIKRVCAVRFPSYVATCRWRSTGMRVCTARPNNPSCTRCTANSSSSRWWPNCRPRPAYARCSKIEPRLTRQRTAPTPAAADPPSSRGSATSSAPSPADEQVAFAIIGDALGASGQPGTGIGFAAERARARPSSRRCVARAVAFDGEASTGAYDAKRLLRVLRRRAWGGPTRALPTMP